MTLDVGGHQYATSWERAKPTNTTSQDASQPPQCTPYNSLPPHPPAHKSQQIYHPQIQTAPQPPPSTQLPQLATNPNLPPLPLQPSPQPTLSPQPSTSNQYPGPLNNPTLLLQSSQHPPQPPPSPQVSTSDTNLDSMTEPELPIFPATSAPQIPPTHSPFPVLPSTSYTNSTSRYATLSAFTLPYYNPGHTFATTHYTYPTAYTCPRQCQP